jgi:glycosyltransferase involved in cell wall biosynthesis
MPVYNAEKYISEAISSILGQTFADFELIVIDDGSTDHSWSILQSFAGRDGRISLYRQPNSGVCVSLNRGCGLARGAYIARMDADDVSLPRRFEKQVAFLDANSQVGILGTWIRDIGANGEPGPIWPLPATPATIPWFLMFGNCLAHPSVMMRNEIFQHLKYDPEATHVEDYDFWIRASELTALANVPEVLLRYRILSQSSSSRHLSVQHEQALRLQHEAKSRLLNADIQENAFPTSELLLKLYSAYRGKRALNRGDESEIVLDVFRRVYLACQMRTSWVRLIPLLPRLISSQAIWKVVRFGRFYAANLPYGFTTQRQVPG